MKFLALSWLLCLTAASPVEKVVELLDELKAKIESDQEAEQLVYDKFACWCEKTTARKASNIDTAKATIGSTTTVLLTLKGAIATLASEIAEFKGKISKNEESMKQLTNVRTKENSDYMQEKGSMETAAEALNRAINVLSSNFEEEKPESAEMKFLSTAVDVRKALLTAQSFNDLSDKDVQLVHKFLENPAAFVLQQKDGKSLLEYTPQSATVTGILKDMYSTFATNLQDLNKEESDKQKGYEELIEQMEKDNAFFKETVVGLEAEKADKAQSEAANIAKLDDTKVQLSDDGEFFETTQSSCKRKSDEWSERKRLRTEEVSGITKALEILTSDDAKTMFANATGTRPIDTFGSEGLATSFLQQVRQAKHVVVRSAQPHEVAYRALQKAIDATSSKRLSTLAQAIKMSSESTTEGHFDDVIQVIDTMMGTLKAEEQGDITKRDWCISDRHNNTKTLQKIEHDIKLIGARTTKLENTQTLLETDIGETSQKKADLESAMAEALVDRDNEHAMYSSAKQMDLDAIQLLQSAIDALGKYGTDNALIQKPVFTVSEDHAPDASFSKSDKFSGARNGILGLLEQIKSQLAQEVTAAEEAETKAQNDYFSLTEESKAAVKGYNATLASLDSALEQTGADLLQAESDHGASMDSKTGVENYLADIKKECDWIMSAFEKRRAERKLEMEGLETAKSTLAGSQGGEFGFLQRRMW